MSISQDASDISVLTILISNEVATTSFYSLLTSIAHNLGKVTLIALRVVLMLSEGSFLRLYLRVLAILVPSIKIFALANSTT
jgi:hypothetical protein